MGKGGVEKGREGRERREEKKGRGEEKKKKRKNVEGGGGSFLPKQWGGVRWGGGAGQGVNLLMGLITSFDPL